MSKEVGSSGISATSLLTIVFVVLKLTEVINWSWMWVLAPTWIPIALLVFMAFVASTSVLIYRLIIKMKG